MLRDKYSTKLTTVVVSRNPQVLYSIRVSGVLIVIWYCLRVILLPG